MIYDREPNATTKLAELRRELDGLKSVQRMGKDIFKPKISELTANQYDFAISSGDLLYGNITFVAATQTMPYARLDMLAFSDQNMTVPITDRGDFGALTIQFNYWNSGNQDGYIEFFIAISTTLDNAYLKFKAYATDYGVMSYVPI